MRFTYVLCILAAMTVGQTSPAQMVEVEPLDPMPQAPQDQQGATSPDDQNTQDIRTVTVNASAVIYLAPDYAEMRLGVEIQSDKLADARAEVDKVGRAIVAAVREQGVEEKDIQAGNTVVKINGGTSPRSFQIHRDYLITVRDLAKTDAAFDAGIAAGANRISSPVYRSSDYARAKEAALKKAANAARSKARALANALDVELGTVQSVTEVKDAKQVTEANDTQTIPGRIPVRAEINATFEVIGDEDNPQA